MSDWFVLDKNPTDQDKPALWGPFEGATNRKKQDAAEEYANLIHPDDESGNTIVLQAKPPEW